MYSQKTSPNTNHYQHLGLTAQQVKWNAVLSLADATGKGWLATIISDNIATSEERYAIPQYIIEALAFISSESIDEKVINKMIFHNTKQKTSITDFLGKSQNESDYPCLYYFISKWLEGQGI